MGRKREQIHVNMERKREQVHVNMERRREHVSYVHCAEMALTHVTNGEGNGQVL